MEVYANEGVEDFVDYTPVSPVIKWKDGVPRDEKEDAEIAAIRTDGRPTLDQSRAIKRLDGVNDEEADAILAAIESDEVREAPPVASPSVFRQFDAVPEEVDDDAEGG
ncbi:hypothetical protein JCM19037_1570 [Geomicrobium sp. JCM 19037]|uniref:hypothetical protein n=1 Tax=Geomicrobium sp. JCM 19037 TaxID=1460634 RepID=UPI00045F1DC5|nr:hypothetical protein [Geomicrobium sp. JCM 19037]GAK03263.1 hypothetical protein JCM19037_1570 [Geomicrobium sp. JCM 19037]